MLRSMYSGISGMKANQTKLDVIANNIANVGTTSFKASKVNFSDTLYQTSNSATAPTDSIGGTNAKSIGLGAKVASINKLMTKGNLLTTGRSLDVSIDGDGYFIAAKGKTTGSIAVDSSSNGITGSTDIDQQVYTRDGNLTLDENGNLLTSNGYRVMGYWTSSSAVTRDTNGNAVVASRVDPDSTFTYDTALRPLVIPDKVNGKAVESFDIGSNGVVTAVTSEGRSVLGQIAMASFKNPEGLKDLGGNFEQESGNSGAAMISTSASTTTNSNSGAFGAISQGYLEASNVDLTEQFTDMISATRAFQASSKMISNGDEILQTITGLIR
ncbi:flagellar hook-basal body protein [Clostridium beijerinckii]|uniref:flagellar hook-basal body protein n=1 Tax=Clostridium beijerinckii TaxID=1520 RepID=UPI00156E4CEE|nr:flagellar hook-basal body complex protein [Clostridium beijerinckii]NRT73667.1 flagellar hook protein FlgE [Clostridium beijerinckii]